MAFDPTKPVDAANVQAAVLRGQFNELKALIDAQTAQIAALEAANTALTARVEALESAMTATALNPGAVTPLSVSFTEPVSAGQGQQIVDGVNTLLGALQRV